MPKNRLVRPRMAELPSTADTVTKARTISEKYSAGPNLSAKSTTIGARNVMPIVPMRAGDERADRRRRERGAGAPAPRHLVAFERGDDGGALARRVEQDRRGRAAVHGAVVDAGEQDEGGGRIDLEGDRQQQRDGQRRPEPRQHADRRADRDADQRPQQVDRRQRDREPAGEGGRASPSEEPLDQAAADIDAEHAGEAEIGDRANTIADDGSRARSAGCRRRARRSTNSRVEAMMKPSRLDQRDIEDEARQHPAERLAIDRSARAPARAPSRRATRQRSRARPSRARPPATSHGKTVGPTFA